MVDECSPKRRDYRETELKVNQTLFSNAAADQGDATMSGRQWRNLIRTALWLTWAALWLVGCSTPQTALYKTYPHYHGEANQHKRLIAAPPGQIFGILTNQSTFTQLVPEYTCVTFDTDTYGIGTRLTVKIDHLLKFTWHTQVKEVIPNKRIRLEFLDGLFKGGAEIWELEPQDGNTLVLQTIVVKPRGWIRQFIWNFKARNRHNAMTEKFLDDLKVMAESPLIAGAENPFKD
jgi:ribosome-associated toxin RatA of RatAB toxin-antitoxin module